MKEKSQIEKNAEERQIELLSTALNEASNAGGHWLNADVYKRQLLYRFIDLRRIRYRVGEEQLVSEHGIFIRRVDYMELYRIVAVSYTHLLSFGIASRFYRCNARLSARLHTTALLANYASLGKEEFASSVLQARCV